MKKAFTLAEVLITLMIIGIVAALTIPSVISNYQQQEFKTGLKKAVSVLNEAIQMNISQEGETPYENQDLFTYLQRHMNILKTGKLNTCYNRDTGMSVQLDDNTAICGDHASNSNFSSNNVFYTADGMRFEFTTFAKNNFKHLYLHESGVDLFQTKIIGSKQVCNQLKDDGGCWSYRTDNIASWSGYCGSYGLESNPNNTPSVPCVLIVDVNGDKKPNPPHAFDTTLKQRQEGDRMVEYPANQSFDYSYPSPADKKLQDVFTIMITDEKAIPFGVVAQRAMYSK